MESLLPKTTEPDQKPETQPNDTVEEQKKKPKSFINFGGNAKKQTSTETSPEKKSTLAKVRSSTALQKLTKRKTRGNSLKQDQQEQGSPPAKAEFRDSFGVNTDSSKDMDPCELEQNVEKHQPSVDSTQLTVNVEQPNSPRVEENQLGDHPLVIEQVETKAEVQETEPQPAVEVK